MSKVIRENLRLDVLSSVLLVALVEKMPDGKKNKSELIRSAIYRIAKEDLSPDEFYAVVQKALEIEKI